MNETKRNLVIVGASLAGAKAAEGARSAGYDGRIVLIGEEAEPPYERPKLSKEILRGVESSAAAHVHPDEFYRDQAIERITERVMAIDARGRNVELASGGIGFDTAVLTTGAVPRRLSCSGAEVPGVHYLRTMDDSLALQRAIHSASRVAVIGGGWIGSEVAASARQMGADVVLIDPAPAPLHRVLGDVVGNVFRQLHEDNGVDLRLRHSVRELRGTQHVEGVVLDDGSFEAADVVVVGIGVAPRTELADPMVGMRVDDGIVVDEHLQSSVDGVYAAGDVASAWHPFYRRHLRVEHWANALNQGLVAGRNAAGFRETYDRLPYFFSDQYDLGMEYVGHGDPADQVVVRGDLEARKFIAFWHRDGLVSAAMNVNVWDVVDDLKVLIASRQPVDVAKLADPNTPLSDVTRAA